MHEYYKSHKITGDWAVGDIRRWSVFDVRKPFVDVRQSSRIKYNMLHLNFKLFLKNRSIKPLAVLQ